ncbi:hypothetical protein LTR78_008164 [Recurvomyces mirabilis]|uniref:Major facilitator superfamily (MFS) profile domain-containing protein n=1 Tax=Recurvomyces mirabilis TaxID=574656 RepID=A0AAE0TTI3_9PEZI|nr:hypothetical protein LTR78_008164 [Recurvomyces mirabilis]KAK5150637.1 hypothetical protein LTS14_009920 [Recurvomyces mirabilis]
MAAEDESSTVTHAASHYAASALDEVGLLALWNSPMDIKLLCAQRFIRLFGYGVSTLILVAYLSILDISDEQTGLFMTLTLAGDVLISLLLTLVADQLGRRKILALGAILMAASGVVFAFSSNYWVLLTAAVLGVITPSGNEIGPFRAIEESVVAHLTPAEHRSTTFAWYTLVGTAGSALGLLSCGWITTVLTTRKDWKVVDAYRGAFFVYAAIGLAKLVLSLFLSSQCELEKPAPASDGSERAPLLGESTPKKPKTNKFGLLSHLSSESRIVLLELCLLFVFDNFASGLAPLSWTTSYFHRHFQLSEGTIGTLFFTTSIISALSILVAASIAQRIGNVKTMVFTHLPSAICLALIGIPSQLPIAITLVVLRACTQSMDAAPRSAFLSAVVLPSERTTVMGIINVVKTLSQTLGPLLTGLLAERDLMWVAFLTAGALKAMYDIGMLLLFVGHRTREERAAEETEGT